LTTSSLGREVAQMFPATGVYACITCNDYKGDYWQPDAVSRILHPMHDHLADHIHEGEDGRLVSLTTTGQFHIERLQLNRPQLVTQGLAKK
jgi:hypothetical protein